MVNSFSKKFVNFSNVKLRFSNKIPWVDKEMRPLCRLRLLHMAYSEACSLEKNNHKHLSFLSDIFFTVKNVKRVFHGHLWLQKCEVLHALIGILGLIKA